MFFRNYPYILLYFAPNKKIGFRPTKNRSKDVYPIRLARNDTLASVSGTAFLNFFRIKHDVSKVYSAAWNDLLGMAQISLEDDNKNRKGD